MNVNSICMNCMQEMLDENGRCAACGVTENEIKTSNRHLAFRTIIKGKYLIGKVIGEGGFGITYLGYDLDLNARVAIKEYCPRDYAGRDVTDLVSVLPFDEETGEFYEAEMVKFIGEAQRLAKFRNQKGIVSVLDYFKENGTAYIVMDYIDGITLREYLKAVNEPLPVNDVLDMMRPVIRSLEKVHEEGLIHRDISLDNIMLAEGKNEIYLIDFGTARSTNIADERSLSVYKKSSYTPIEQQSRHGKQGPWTDVYELCATIYYCITGKLIPESLDRVVMDELVPPHELGIEISAHMENVLMKGLAVKIEDRIQSMKELEDGLFDVEEEKQDYQYTTPSKTEKEDVVVLRPKKKKKIGLIVGLITLVILCIGGGFGYKYIKEKYEYEKTHVFSETSRVPGATTVMDLYTLEGELLSSTYYDAEEQVVQTITYSFDGNDLVKETCDSAGSLIGKEEYVFNATDSTLEESIYNEKGVLTQIQVLQVSAERPYENGEAVGEIVATTIFDEQGRIAVEEDLRSNLRTTYEYSTAGKVVLTYDIQGDYICKKETYNSDNCLLEEISYSLNGLSKVRTYNTKGICVEHLEYDEAGKRVIVEKTFDENGKPLEDILRNDMGEQIDKSVYVYLDDGTSAIVKYNHTGGEPFTTVEGNREGFIAMLKEQMCEMYAKQREIAGKKELDFNETLMELAQNKANESTKSDDYSLITKEDGEYYRSRTSYRGSYYGAHSDGDVLDLVSSNEFWVHRDAVYTGERIGSSKYSGIGIGIEQYASGEWFCYYILCHK